MKCLTTNFEMLLASVFISICMHVYYVVSGINVYMNDNITASNGEDGIELKCSYTKENVKAIFTVALLAKNRTNHDKFDSIVTFVPGVGTSINPSGEYLKDRITMTNITQESTEATMSFKQIECTDQNHYRCKVTYLNGNSDPDSEMSLPTTIIVTVKQQTPHISSDFNMSSLSLPREGDNLTLVCSGDVGRHPGYILWQQIYTNKNISFKYVNETNHREPLPLKCSFNKTSYLTFQLSAVDFNAIIRCVVVSHDGNNETSVVTAPLEFHFSVRNVAINKLPDKQIYDTTIQNITLMCNADGNPKPTYTWYNRKNINNILSTSNKYVINDVIKNNSGTYICEVNNSINGETNNDSTSVEITIENQNETFDKNKHSEKKIYLLIVIGIAGVFFILAIIIGLAICRRRAKRKSLPKGKEETTSKSFSENFAKNNPCYTSDSGTRINDNSNDSGNAMDTRNDKLENEEKLVINHPINFENSKRGGYESVVIDDDKPVISSEKNAYGHDDPQTIRQHNKEYIDHQKQEEKKMKKSPISNQTVEYAQVNEATKLKNKTKSNDTDQTTVNVGVSAISQKGINGKSKDNTTEITDNIDTPKKNTTRDETESLNKSRLRERNNTQSFVNDDKEKGKVAIVSPFVGSSVKSEGDMQKENTNAEIQQEIEDISGQTVDNAQNFDTNNQKNQETNGDPEPSLKYNKTEPHTNQTFDSEEYPQIDSVSMNDIQDEGQVDQNSEQQSSND